MQNNVNYPPPPQRNFHFPPCGKGRILVPCSCCGSTSAAGVRRVRQAVRTGSRTTRKRGFAITSRRLQNAKCALADDCRSGRRRIGRRMPLDGRCAEWRLDRCRQLGGRRADGVRRRKSCRGCRLGVVDGLCLLVGHAGRRRTGAGRASADVGRPERAGDRRRDVLQGGRRDASVDGARVRGRPGPDCR